MALDGSFDAFREYGNRAPKVMWKMLFCVALNPEVLYEAFAHGMMSKNDLVQTFAIGFVRNVIVKANEPTFIGHSGDGTFPSVTFKHMRTIDCKPMGTMHPSIQGVKTIYTVRFQRPWLYLVSLQQSKMNH